MNYAIQIADLDYRWPGQQQNLLSIPKWQVEAGQTVFLYGASGSGKSTLLNLLAGILLPQRGQVNLLSTDITQLSARHRDRFRANHIGIVFQQFNLVPYLSVEMNIALAAHFADSQPKKLGREQLMSLLTPLSLDEAILQRKATALSVGQQQRVAVARALINRPQLIIADEPTSALDSDTRDGFIELLMQLAKAQGSTVVFVSHDRALASHFDMQIDMQQFQAAQGR